MNEIQGSNYYCENMSFYCESFPFAFEQERGGVLNYHGYFTDTYSSSNELCNYLQSLVL